MAEKTEKATPKKLRDARKKGQVAKSQDFPSAFTFVVSIATTMYLAGYLFKEMANYLIGCFKIVGTGLDLQNRVISALSMAPYVILNCSLPILVVTLAFGILVNFIIVGPLFATEALKPDIKRLNPIENLKNMFKIKTFVELIKSIVKITGALVLIYTVVKDSLSDIVATAALPVEGSALVFSAFLYKVIIRVGIFFIVVAIFDLIFQKKNFETQMKMEKFEVKQEYKDTEGNPQIKSKRRQAAQEIAYQSGPPSVKRAKAVITNPTHIAVAIEYHPENEPAPKIVTMGKGPIADEIIKVALEYKIPIMRNVPLAQALYERGTIDDYIPEENYQAVAQILKWIEGLESSDVNMELFT